MRDPPERRFQRDRLLAPRQLGRPEDLPRGAREELLRERHLVARVGVRRVELEHRELGVVLGRDALVPEVPVDLVDLREAAHDEALQVQLRGDAQEEVEVERVVVRHERARGRAARERLHHRRLHLDEAARVEEAADEPHDLRPDLERPARLRRDDEVDVALPVLPLDVRQAVPLVGQRPQGLREEIEGARPHGQLPRARPEDRSGDSHVVAEVELLQKLPVARAERVLLHVSLHAVNAVREVEEDRLPHLADREDAARHADEPIGLGRGVEGGGVLGRPFRNDVRHEMRGVPAIRVESAPEGGDARARRAPVRDLLGELELPGRFRRGGVLRSFGHRAD